MSCQAELFQGERTIYDFVKSGKDRGIYQDTTVCHAAQEAGMPHCEYIDSKKCDFSHKFSLVIFLSEWSQR